jgi:DNA-binding XRE family transcriptional regulator
MPRKPQMDDLEKYIFERGQIEPGFPAIVAARTSRRILQHDLAHRRIALGLTQAEVAKRMKTTQSAIARLESGEHDVRVGTLERYATVVGCSIGLSLKVAS